MDPVAYFNGLDEFMKKTFMEELKEQGFFHAKKHEKEAKVIQKNAIRVEDNRNKEPVFQPFADKNITYKQETESEIAMSILKRKESSFLRRNPEAKKDSSSNNRKNSGEGNNQQKNKVLHGDTPTVSQFNDEMSKTSNSNFGVSKGPMSQSHR